MKSVSMKKMGDWSASQKIIFARHFSLLKQSFKRDLNRWKKWNKAIGVLLRLSIGMNVGLVGSWFIWEGLDWMEWGIIAGFNTLIWGILKGIVAKKIKWTETVYVSTQWVEKRAKDTGNLKWAIKETAQEYKIPFLRLVDAVQARRLRKAIKIDQIKTLRGEDNGWKNQVQRMTQDEDEDDSLWQESFVEKNKNEGFKEYQDLMSSQEIWGEIMSDVGKAREK